jgi:hypothetical protein
VTVRNCPQRRTFLRQLPVRSEVGIMARSKGDGSDKSEIESLVDTAESQGLPRPAAEEVVSDALSEDVAPDKLKAVVEDAARAEKEDLEEAARDED